MGKNNERRKAEKQFARRFKREIKQRRRAGARARAWLEEMGSGQGDQSVVKAAAREGGTPGRSPLS